MTETTNPVQLNTDEQNKIQQMVQDILQEATRQGASAAEVGASIDAGFSVTVRMGDVETVEYNRDKGVGITVYFGQHKGSASTSDTDPEAIKSTIQAACNIARYTSEDPCNGLADKALMAQDFPDLKLNHPWSITPEEAIEDAKVCEQSGMAYDKRLTNSEGATVSTYSSYSVYGNSHGFLGAASTTRHSLSCGYVATEGDGMERDFYYSVARDHRDLESLEAVGREAGKRTVERLGAKRLKTQQVPILFVPEMASGILSQFVAAIAGRNLYRQSSFLLDHLDKQVMPTFINVEEQPLIPKGLGSAAFDSEGVATQHRRIVDEGILRSYVLGSYSARKLGMQSTGNSNGVHNLVIEPGKQGLKELIKTMGRGLLVTELMGQGVNLVTGNYSRGAWGYWVENGELQYPVEEITVAGNLKDMLMHITEVGNDVDIRRNVRTGSLLIEGMTIAGE